MNTEGTVKMKSNMFHHLYTIHAVTLIHICWSHVCH